MRIPSSLNDDSLYRQSGRPTVPRQPYRRLLRLLLAMALVIAVMRQAGDPRVYELFFSQPPATLDTPTNRTIGTIDTGGTAARNPPPTAGGQAVDGEPAVAPEPPSEESLSRIVAALDEAIAKRWIGCLAEARAAGQRSAAELRLPEELVDALNAAAQAADEARAADEADPQQQITRATPPSESPTAAPDWSQPSWLQALQQALDQWALDRVDQAATWRASDTLAFYRLLEDPQPPWLLRQDATEGGVISLLQQPEVYLHRRVALPGSVARAIHRDAAENPFGVSDYWELWLRPRDGSEQPLVFFTAEVPREIAQINHDASLDDGPPVWVDGVYLKRLAYRSAAGRQLAPALVGSLHTALPTAAAREASPAPPSSRPSGWLLLGVSALLGGATALLIFRQTRKEALRTRALRRSAKHQEVRFPDSLSERPASEHGAGE